MLYEIRQIAQNGLMSFAPVREFASRFHRTGMNGSVEAAQERLAFYERHCQLRGASVLELGPGQTPEVLLGARDRGAERCVGVDVRSYREQDRVRALGVEIIHYDGSQLPFEDATFDVVLSSDVLEHVRRPALTVAEVARVLKAGGVCVAHIDLRDHYHLGIADLEVDCIKYPTPVWNAMTWHRSSYVNRLRQSEWRALFATHGLTVEWAAGVTSHELGVLYDAGRLPRRTLGFAREDVITVQFDVVARRAARR